MTAKEYLRQAYHLENKIKMLGDKIATLRLLATSVSSPGFEERYNASRNTDAPQVKAIEKIILCEQEVQEKLVLLLDLQKQIEDVIAKVDDVDCQMVLTYRYLHNLSWCRIGEELCIDESTARRWHDKAITKVSVPQNAIKI